MPRKKNNPSLVKELIDNLWNENYSQEKFEENYNSLNSDDMWKVRLNCLCFLIYIDGMVSILVLLSKRTAGVRCCSFLYSIPNQGLVSKFKIIMVLY